MAGAWAQRTGGLRLRAGGLLASAVCCTLLGVFESVWSLVAVLVVMGIGDGLGYTAGLYTYSQTVSDDRQASAQGLMGASEVLLGEVMSVLGAWLYDTSGRGLVWTVIPMLAVLALAGGLWWRGLRLAEYTQPAAG